MKQKMKVEIWSDIMCPFCYIGKRNFEAGLKQFTDSNNIEVVWKSFQLNPNIAPGSKTSVYEYLAKHKGISRERAKQMNDGLTKSAEKIGLSYNFDKVLVVNSLKAHAVIQFAKTKGLGDQAEERFFYANFTEGKDYSDTIVLTELGKDIGLTEAEVGAARTDPKYAAHVQEDLLDAQNLGISAVPFFIFNRKYAVSGAQPLKAFLDALEMSHAEWKKENPGAGLHVSEGPSCEADESCQ